MLHIILPLLGVLFVGGRLYAAPLCETGLVSSMANPPAERVLRLSLEPLPDTVMFLGVQATGATIASITHDKAELTPQVSKDSAKAGGIRLYRSSNVVAGLNTVTIAYSKSPVADSIYLVTCGGMDATTPIASIDLTPSAETKETLSIAGKDAATASLEFLASTDLQVTTSGVVMRGMKAGTP